jgi:hypothetical protein
MIFHNLISDILIIKNQIEIEYHEDVQCMLLLTMNKHQLWI